MRPTTSAYIATSLEGYIARTDGAIVWLGEPPEGEDYGWSEFIGTVDAIVMGRATFEQVLKFDFFPYEGTPLTVLSKTMTTVPEHLKGKVEVSSKSPDVLLRQLGGAGCKRVYIDGGKTIQSFLRADLVDELTITTLPVLIGKGIPLFGTLDADVLWEHLTTKVFEGGLVKSCYCRRR